MLLIASCMACMVRDSQVLPLAAEMHVIHTRALWLGAPDEGIVLHNFCRHGRDMGRVLVLKCCEHHQDLESKEAVSEQKPAMSLAAAAIAAAKAATSSIAAHNHGKIAVTETRRFAGKDIEVRHQPHKLHDLVPGVTAIIAICH